jgi:hypothetical protein
MERKILNSDANLNVSEVIQDYLDGIDKAFTEKSPEANILYGILHLDMHADLIKRNKSYAPRTEIDMIFHLLNMSSQMLSSVKEELLVELINRLIIFGDIFIQRTEEKESSLILEKIEKTILPLNDSIFNRIQAPKDNMVTQYIEEKLQKSFSTPLFTAIHPMAYFDNILQSENKTYIFDNKTYTLSKQLIEEAREYFSYSKSEEDLKKCLKDENSFLSKLIEYHIDGSLDNDFLHVIQWLQEQFTDKEKFALLCLKNYKNVFKKINDFSTPNLSNRSALFMNHYLEGRYKEIVHFEQILIQVISMLDASLRPGRIRKILQFSNSIDSPQLHEMIKTYPYSFNLIMLIKCGLFPFPEKLFSSMKDFRQHPPFHLKVYEIELISDTLGQSLSMLHRKMDDLELKSFPPFIPLHPVIGCSTDVVEAYKTLYLQAIETNSKMDPDKQLDVTILFNCHRKLISLLIKLLGVSAIENMKNCLKNFDLITLQKKLEKLDCFYTWDINEVLIKNVEYLKISLSPNLDTLRTDLILAKFLEEKEALDITKYSEKTLNALKKFIEKFYKINEKITWEFHHRDCLMFLKANKNQIFLLINLLEEKSLEGMTALMVNTVITLERTLNNLPEEMDQELLQALSKYFKIHSPSFKIILNFLLVFNALTRRNAHEQSSLSLAEFYMQKAKEFSCDDFLKYLKILLLKTFFKEEKLSLTIDDMTKICERVSLEHCVQLAAASQAMEESEYRQIFIELLRLDLTAGNINDFLHNPKQKNPLGKMLADHNQSIRENLRSRKISPEKALDYDKKHEFIIYPSNDKDFTIANHYLALWNHLITLKENLDQMEKKTPKELKLTKNLDALTHSVKKKNQSNSDNKNLIIIKLLSSELESKLLNIKRNCESYIKEKSDSKNMDKIVLSKDFYKSASNFNIKFEEIKKLTSKMSKHPVNSELRYFTVEQWKKDKIMTFFLGDSVGCCLGTNNGDFSALVQRRMDDALLFHVAIDKMTGQAAALIWLFLAVDQHNNIVLVANFFEVNEKYGSSKNIRTAILNELLEFTWKYMKDNPGIDNFYMRTLTYGRNKGDLNAYPIVPFILKDKLGGPFISADEMKNNSSTELTESKRITLEKYFLVALECNQFHQFDPDILKKEKRSDIYAINDLIQEAAVNLAKTERNSEKIISLLIEKHSLELEPFFDLPLKENPHFTKAVIKAVVIAHIKNDQPFLAARMHANLFSNKYLTKFPTEKELGNVKNKNRLILS